MKKSTSLPIPDSNVSEVINKITQLEEELEKSKKKLEIVQKSPLNKAATLIDEANSKIDEALDICRINRISVTFRIGATETMIDINNGNIDWSSSKCY